MLMVSVGAGSTMATMRRALQLLYTQVFGTGLTRT